MLLECASWIYLNKDTGNGKSLTLAGDLAIQAIKYNIIFYFIRKIEGKSLFAGFIGFRFLRTE